MKRILSAFLLACMVSSFLPILVSAEAEPYRIYVSTTGNDNADGSMENPFLTMERAKQEVRKVKKNNKNNIEVIFRGGLYRFDKTVELTPDDNAPKGKTITYKSYEGEKPVFSGAKELNGQFEPYKDGIYKMEIPKGIKSRMLLINGENRTLARIPNNHDWFKINFDGVSEKYYTMRLDDSVYNLLEEGESDIYFKTIVAYRATGGTIKEIYKTSDGRIMGVVDEPSAVLDHTYRNDVSKYYLENSLSFLDNPGEYYIDSENGILYYMPTYGEDVNNLSVEYAYLTTLIDFKGKKGNRVSGISLDGIGFTGTADNDLMKKGFSDTAGSYYDDYLLSPDKDNNIIQDTWAASQKSDYFLGAVNGTWVENFSCKNCDFYYMNESAIRFVDGLRNFDITGNTFNHIGSSGIYLGRSVHVTKSPDVFLENINITNNLMYYISFNYNSPAIGVNISHNLNLCNNDLDHLGYGGLVTNTVWYMDYQIWKVGNYTIKNNRVENTMAHTYNNDLGAIYNAGPVVGKNIIKDNYIKGGEIGNHGTYGIYFDGNNRGWLCEDNVVEDYKVRPIYMQIISTQIATHNTAKNNYVAPFPIYYWGNVSKSVYFREERNVVNQYDVFRDADDFPPKAQEIIKNAGLSAEYKHLYERVQKPYKLNAENWENRYRYKEGIESTIPVKVANNTDKDADVCFEVTFSASHDEDFKWKTTVPANVKDYIVNIPVMFKSVDRVEVGEILITGVFPSGDVLRAGVGVSYQYVAEDLDCTMVDTESDGYAENGIWCTMDYMYDIFGRYIRMAKNTGPSYCIYKPDFMPSGEYKVVLGGTYTTYNDAQATFTVHRGDEVNEVVINQKGSTLPSEWDLGTYTFDESKDNFVKYTRRDYSKEAANSGIGAYVFFERLNTTPDELAAIKAQYIEHMSAPKESNVDERDVIILNANEHAENYNSSTRVDSITLPDGRIAQHMSNHYSRLHFEKLLKTGTYEVYIRKNVSGDYCNKMRVSLAHDGGTENIIYSLQEGKSGWMSLGTYKFTDKEPAELLFAREAGAEGKPIVDEVKFVRISD